ncbi:JAB domain-containing protein similar to deubiquitination enzymes [Paraburkholderia sp. BL6665CI2N2]|uniref:ThiF family adenylyltransferase n=1 Tax=Paraburkholderia sp. BL6665CI2N2 TaxID=1938806 RepID=UPI001066E2A8|nr:ThiF family adenylyltransferase [Paraburkholderia sp. BL6665CI2N2]TDY24592.1 JAB domain-containing protein similar to deubiquitination enzymes [Paraburkholderia sp. BL6665CI2N2]
MSADNLLSVLAISGMHRDRLRRHLFPGDGKEAVAIALCGRAVGTNRSQLLVHEIIEVPYDACRIREPDAVAWSVESVLPALNRAMQLKLTVVKFHSHPGGYPEFSKYDDASDRAFFKAVDDVLDNCDARASVVMLPDSRFFGRNVQNGVLGNPIDLFRIAGDDFEFIRPCDGPGDGEQIPEHAVRLIQTFGEGTYRTLRQLRIGVVGASGTGSIVLEQLARNCVGEVVPVDPDHLERKNLNRILNSRGCDAAAGRSKVDRAREAILAMELGTTVSPLEKDIGEREAILALSECDILFGCVDSVDGRHILNKIATHFLIPLIDLGVRIDADGNGSVDQVCGAIHTVQPGGSSLMSRGVYSQADLNAAFMKRREPDRYKEMLKAGYVRGVNVDRPAVISLNMLVAAYAVNEMLARLMPYRVDPNSNFAQRRISLSDPLASSNEGDGEVCPAFVKRVGFGLAEPLLGIMDL